MSKKRRPGRDPEMDAAPGESHGDVTVVDVEMDHKPEGSVSASKKSKNEEPMQTSFGEEEAYTDIDHTSDAPPITDPAEVDLDSTAAHSSASSTDGNGSKIELNFKGSEILRAKFPKPFEVAEQIATDWVQGGRFEGLPLGHPLAQYFAAKSLRKAKELEKKVMESPLTEKLAMQALTAGMKAQEIISQVRAKTKK